MPIIRRGIFFLACSIGVIACQPDHTTHDKESVPTATVTDTLSEVAVFEEYLNIFDPRRMESIREAAHFYQNYAAKSSAPLRDESFLRFQTFYYGVIEQLNENVSAILPEGLGDQVAEAGLMAPPVSSSASQFQEELQENGLRLTFEAGMYAIAERPGYLHEIAAPYISPAIKQFLVLRTSDMAHEFASDGKLLISFAELGERTARWENYRTKFPASVFSEEAERQHKRYLRALLVGLDNTPTFAPTDGQPLLPEVAATYEAFIEKYAKTPSGTLIQAYYDVLKTCNFQRCASVKQFLNSPTVQKAIQLPGNNLPEDSISMR